jgi:hypothetical protein
VAWDKYAEHMDERMAGDAPATSEPPTVTVDVPKSGGGGNILCVDPGNWTYTALVWLGGTTAAGILGNAAYDAFKHLVHRLRSAERLQLTREDAILVAGLALAVRCQSLLLETPNLDALTCEAREASRGGWHVVFTGAPLTALVEVPSGDPTETRSKVSILRHRSIEQMREFEQEVAAQLRLIDRGDCPDDDYGSPTAR